MKRYLIIFSYDGSEFNGYQKQEGYRTVQECIENALKYINNNTDTKITSSGRTDKGVHALKQCAHFDLNVDITEYKLKCALNSNLPDDIHIIEAKEVDKDFHARYMVKEKEYKYFLNTKEYNPLERNYVFQYNKELDLKLMQEAIKYFLGEHSFKSFTPTKDAKENCVRTINYVNIEDNNGTLIFTFRGTGFIKYQIRNMVGYLIKVGEHKKSKDDIESILKKEDRRLASITAHPEGLYLTNVIY